MVNLKQVKIILQTAGISRLQIQFDDKLQIVNADYVFRGKPGTRRITYQEIVESLTIGVPEVPACPAGAEDS